MTQAIKSLNLFYLVVQQKTRIKNLYPNSQERIQGLKPRVPSFLESYLERYFTPKILEPNSDGKSPNSISSIKLKLQRKAFQIVKWFLKDKNQEKHPQLEGLIKLMISAAAWNDLWKLTREVPLIETMLEKIDSLFDDSTSLATLSESDSTVSWYSSLIEETPFLVTTFLSQAVTPDPLSQSQTQQQTSQSNRTQE